MLTVRFFCQTLVLLAALALLGCPAQAQSRAELDRAARAVAPPVKPPAPRPAPPKTKVVEKVVYRDRPAPAPQVVEKVVYRDRPAPAPTPAAPAPTAATRSGNNQKDYSKTISAARRYRVVGSKDGLRLTFPQTHTVAEVARIRVFSSQYRGLRSMQVTVQDSVAILSPVGGAFRPGEVVSVTLPPAISGRAGDRGRVYQFRVGAGIGPAVFRASSCVPVAKITSSVILGDVDGNGDLDILTSNNGDNTVSVRLNDGTGHFTTPDANSNVAVGKNPGSMALGDVDGDGDLDLLTSNNGDNTVSVRLNDGTGHFTTPATDPDVAVGKRPHRLALGDVDGDGDLDLLTANSDDNTVSVRLNNGTGHFTTPAANPDLSVYSYPFSLALGDVDGDGDLDMLVANIGDHTVNVRLNDGTGHFTALAANSNVAVGKWPGSMALGDVDGDGDLDLLTANYDDNTVSVRFNDSSGHFTAPVANPNLAVGKHPNSIALGDVDGDGDLDMLTANVLDNTVSVRLNDGRGRFTAPATNPHPAVGKYPNNVVLGDVDGDGDLDALITNLDDNTVSVLLNTRP